MATKFSRSVVDKTKTVKNVIAKLLKSKEIQRARGGAFQYEGRIYLSYGELINHFNSSI